MNNPNQNLLNQLNNRTEFPISDPALPNCDCIEICQTCNHDYDSDDVMIVESIGPICLNCLHDIAKNVLE